jgi:hypothetical protein
MIGGCKLPPDLRKFVLLEKRDVQGALQINVLFFSFGNFLPFYLLFTIVLWYCQHATNLTRATVFVVCMSSTRVLVWVRGRAEQKSHNSLHFEILIEIEIFGEISPIKKRKKKNW